MRNQFFWIFVLTLILTCNVTYSQWQKCNNGLYFADIKSIAVNGTDIFAISNSGGIYFSSDYGKNWEMNNYGHDLKYFTCIDVQGEYIYLGTNEDGIFISSDYGKTWEHKAIGLQKTFDLIKKHGNTLYANLNQLFSISSDNGETWVSKYKGMDAGLNNISFKDNNIFVSTYANGIFLSTNNGETWIKKDSGIEKFIINTLSINGENIWIGTDKQGIFLSTDNGNTWNAKNEGIQNKSIRSIYANENFVIAGSGNATLKKGEIYVSTNNGETWTLKSDTSNNSNLKIVRILDDNFFAIDQNNFKFSSDKGNTWETRNNGLSEVNATCMIEKDGTLFIGTYGNYFYKSSDEGKTWIKVVKTGQLVYSMDYIKNTLFIITNYGLYRSTDEGDSWTKKSKGLNGYPIYIKSCENIIYVGDNGSGIYVSLDNGETWNLSGNIGLVQDITNKENDVFVGTNNGVYFTSDNGASWIDKSSNLTNKDIRTVDVVGDILYVGTYGDGLFMSTDYGDTWISKNNGLPLYIFTVACAIKGEYIITANFQEGIFFSSDNGEHWLKKSKGFEKLDIREILISENNIYAVTYGEGIFRTTFDEIMSVDDDNFSEDNKIRIYPNPATSTITLTGVPVGIDECRIYDVLGNRIHQPSHSGSDTPQAEYLMKIDVSSLPPGVYFVRFGNLVQKFVVVR